MNLDKLLCRVVLYICYHSNTFRGSWWVCSVRTSHFLFFVCTMSHFIPSVSTGAHSSVWSEVFSVSDDSECKTPETEKTSDVVTFKQEEHPNMRHVKDLSAVRKSPCRKQNCWTSEDTWKLQFCLLPVAGRFLWPPQSSCRNSRLYF